MNGRTRKLGLAASVIGGLLLFGVGFAGAQAPVVHKAPKTATVVSTYSGSPTDGGGGCGGEFDTTADVNPADY